MPKIVFLTGGTGSFGQGFVSHLLQDQEVSMVRVFSRDEHKQRAMRERFRHERVSFFIGDVRDKDRLLDAMESSDWVVHAAALKQAPLGEIEPQEFVKTNIQGSINVVQAAFEVGAERALLVSTDKAVEPINLYGATKMCAERVFVQADACRGARKTRFACTRYGNVANTNGSIIPILLGLPAGQPATVYDPQATRFWISLDEANRFVLKSLREMQGGETFIPRLKAVRVTDIVKAVRPDSPMVVGHPRAGDKRHEVLDMDPATGYRYSSDAAEMMTVEEIRENVFGQEPARQSA